MASAVVEALGGDLESDLGGQNMEAEDSSISRSAFSSVTKSTPACSFTSLSVSICNNPVETQQRTITPPGTYSHMAVKHFIAVN